jgi:HEAT repeat protein
MTTARRLRALHVAERLDAMADLIQSGGCADAETLEALAACLADARKIVQRRAAETLAALGAQGTSVRDVLLRTLQSDVTKQRWGAAYALSLLGDAPAVTLPTLLEALGSDDGDVRWAAGNILVRLRGNTALVDALRQLLGTGSSAQRKMAAYCLRDLDARSPAVERALFAALHDPDTYVRLAAIAAIGRLAIDRATAAQGLMNLLAGPNANLQRAAAAVLGVLGDRSDAVRAALTRASQSADVSLARAAERSLRLLTDAAKPEAGAENQ